MSMMWKPEEFRTDTRPIAIAATDRADARLRARVWTALLVANVAAWVAGVYLTIAL